MPYVKVPYIKRGSYLHITYIYGLVYSKSFGNYFDYQTHTKCCVSGCYSVLFRGQVCAGRVLRRCCFSRCFPSTIDGIHEGSTCGERGLNKFLVTDYEVTATGGWLSLTVNCDRLRPGNPHFRRLGGSYGSCVQRNHVPSLPPCHSLLPQSELTCGDYLSFLGAPLLLP